MSHDGRSMRILVTGVSGAIGAELVPALAREGHELRGFARDPARARARLAARRDARAPARPGVAGDAVTGAGLDVALEGVDVAYFLIHSMEGAAAAGFEHRERE